MHSRASSIRPGTAVGTVEEELELGGTLDRVSSFDHRTTRGSKHSSGEGANTIVNRVKVKHGQTTVISISGAAGCGKSSLVQSVASTARAHGYFTSAKFDQVKKTPFEPLIKVLSSLFRQIFSEEDVSTPFHNNIRNMVQLAMIGAAGLGVAYHAKPVVAEAAHARIEHCGLRALLFMQGYPASAFST